MCFLLKIIDFKSLKKVYFKNQFYRLNYNRLTCIVIPEICRWDWKVKTSHDILSESIHEDIDRFLRILVNRFRQNLNRLMGMLSNRFKQNLNWFAMMWMNWFITETNRFNQTDSMFNSRHRECTFPYISPNWEFRNSC